MVEITESCHLRAGVGTMLSSAPERAGRQAGFGFG